MQTLSLLDKKFIGTEDLRRDLTDILEKLPKEEGGMVITQRGKPKAILVDIESYIELQEQIADADERLIKEVNEAVAEVEAGKGIPLAEVIKKLGL